MKANIGCGWECRDGWINLDNTPKPQRVDYPITFMDVTEKWTYDDNTFDHILSEHMIEHIEDTKGLFALTEAHRTMKEGGVIHISCPDRTFYEQLPKKENEYQEYIGNYCRMIFKREPRTGDGAKISNRGLNQQGHIWVPTAEQLIKKVEAAGFKNVKQVVYGTSEHSVFTDVDVNDGVRNWESVCVEGTK